VHAGDGFYTSVLPTITPAGESSADINSLSIRELEVLSQVARGRSSKDIALKLKVTLRTVKTYRERVMRKLNLHSATELAAYAAHHGLLATGKSGK